jgi:hypothetical protein
MKVRNNNNTIRKKILAWFNRVNQRIMIIFKVIGRFEIRVVIIIREGFNLRIDFN